MALDKSRNPEAFSAFELAGWNANIAGYDRAFGAVARQTIAALLDATDVKPGSHVLDLCCGTGILAAGARARHAAVVGLDFSSEAVAIARRRVLGVRFEQGDAQDLPFADGSFDAVLCGYGLMHLPDPGTALAEMLRVLRPGGRAAASVWDEEGTGFSLVYEAVRARGSLEAPLPHGPDAFQFGTVPKMRAALLAAGFADVIAWRFDQAWDIDNAEQYIASILAGTVRSRALLAAQSEAASVEIRAYIADYLARFRTPTGAIAVPMPAVIGSGRRPG